MRRAVRGAVHLCDVRVRCCLPLQPLPPEPRARVAAAPLPATAAAARLRAAPPAYRRANAAAGRSAGRALAS
jgi:hypothetical protein